VVYYRENSSPVSETNIVNQSFAWMFGGLMLTALASFVVASKNSLANLVLTNNIVFFGLIIAELVLVFFLSLRVQHMSFGAALTTFLVYSVLNGLTISSIFFIYTATSIAASFFVAALVFGIMAFYGYTTKRDLTSIGNLAFMALIGVILASLVNLFLKSNVLSDVVSYLAIVIFVALTAYDTQKIKRMAESGASENMGVWGALALYLDFINIFLNLLRIFGRQRD
jgi:FtsH-binding integral membrane protein